MTRRHIDAAQHAADAWELAARAQEDMADAIDQFSPTAAAIYREKAASLRARAPSTQEP